MLPYPFGRGGVEEDYSVKESAYAARCGFYLERSGLDEVLGEDCEPRIVIRVSWWADGKFYSVIFDRIGQDLWPLTRKSFVGCIWIDFEGFCKSIYAAVVDKEVDVVDVDEFCRKD